MIQVKIVPSLSASEINVAEEHVPHNTDNERVKLMTQLASWFVDRPSANAEPFERLGAILNSDRRFPGEVRSGFFDRSTDAQTTAKVIYCGGSPEVWLAEITFQEGAEYGIFSWYGMHQPSRQILNADGFASVELSTRLSRHGSPESEAYELLYSCEYQLQQIDLAARINGAPRYRDDFVSSIDSRQEGYSPAISKLNSLPRRAVMAHLTGESEVSLGTTWPNNYRSEPYFRQDGTFSEEILSRAVPDIKIAYDTLTRAGFEPRIVIHRNAGKQNDPRAVPGIELMVDVQKALPLLHYEISAPKIAPTDSF